MRSFFRKTKNKVAPDERTTLEESYKLFTDKCEVVTPYQPDGEDISFVTQEISSDKSNHKESLYGNHQKGIIVDGIPFSRYWQAKGADSYIFHPMVWGRYVFQNSDDNEFLNNLELYTDKVGVRLPNEGIAFYYPNSYPLNRMTGPDFMYSGIAQAEAIAGYAAAAKKRPSLKHLLNSVVKSIYFEHKHGGINLSGIAQLELPLFRSNPEIILNGWLHALLYILDYAEEFGDKSATDYVQVNLQFLLDNFQVWYDDDRMISRYSDTCPHRMVVRYEGAMPNFATVYKSKDPRLPNYQVPVELDLDNQLGGFDNRIKSVNRNASKLVISLCCSGLYENYLVADNAFELELTTGGYDPHRASSDGTGDKIQISSEEKNRHWFVKIEDPNRKFLLGYPTNFSKANGKNYYHMQHIVAMAYLGEYTDSLPQTMIEQLKKLSVTWLNNNSKFSGGDGLEFEDVQVVLDGINRGKLRNQALKADKLFA